MFQRALTSLHGLVVEGGLLNQKAQLGLLALPITGLVASYKQFSHSRPCFLVSSSGNLQGGLSEN